MKETGLRRKFDEAAGMVCKALFPIMGEYYLGRGDSVAICTLGSMTLLREMSYSEMMDRVVIAGRLLSENKGIDSLLLSISGFPKLTKLVLCGKDVPGHLPGHSLIRLHKSGINTDRRIIGSRSPYPYLTSSDQIISSFREKVSLLDMIGETSIAAILPSVA